MRQRALVCTLAWLAFVLASILFAQRVDRAIITGIVHDGASGVIPGACVTLLNERTGVSTELGTNGDGVYKSPSLVPGTYTLRVDSAGFAIFRRSGIKLIGGQIFSQNCELRLGLGGSCHARIQEGRDGSTKRR